MRLLGLTTRVPARSLRTFSAARFAASTTSTSSSGSATPTDSAAAAATVAAAAAAAATATTATTAATTSGSTGGAATSSPFIVLKSVIGAPDVAKPASATTAEAKEAARARVVPPVTQTLLDSLPVRLQDIEEAYGRIKSSVSKTDLVYSLLFSQMVGLKVYLKMENLQMTGSYKERGALNKIMQLTAEERSRGVICSSAGNHAQAVSYHATRLGIDAKIIMPETTPWAKVSGTKRWGARIVLHGRGFDESLQEARRLEKEEGRVFIHAFNDSAIIAGQGTIGLELLEQNPYLDAVVVPIGGGGLISGVLATLKAVNPRIKVFGVQSEEMASMKRSMARGEVTTVPLRKTVADGIAVGTAGKIPFDIVYPLVDDVVTVDEDEISYAVLKMLEIQKTVVEGSGAAALAALLNRKLPLAPGSRVACICSGGNIDMPVVGKIIDRGLVQDGRLTRFVITVLDQPGSLARVLTYLSSKYVNVSEVAHERAFHHVKVGYTQNIITCETRGFDHIADIEAGLTAEGFQFERIV